MSIFNSVDSAHLDFVCKARQVNALLEMAKSQYASNSELQDVLGLIDVVLDDLLATVQMNYETLLDMATRRSA